ncbi:hypothetical protein CBS101457_005502 [Exobasidium rhododendri]|nr:hypothetical protein CBS101457_005502 [Exobasidium rhododendri]
MHPDQYYSPRSSLNNACHESEEDEKDKKRKKHKKDQDRVGHWGAPVSVCDSPKHLIEATLDWVAANWIQAPSSSVDEKMDLGKGFDFILWTGDTARHDIDFTLPRTTSEILDYNRWALGLLEDRFPGAEVIPTIGNNDFKAHNIFFEGPNYFTKAYLEIWNNHIPDHQHSTFLQGGYFAKEVLADELAVFSLNTLYWYDANAAVRGCKGRSDPGTIQLAWMEDTLDYYRNRSMQVQLMGHVPPTAGNYFEDCYERYSDIVLRYQDTIVGQHYGHMNIDAWFIQEEVSLTSSDMVVEGEVMATESQAEDPIAPFSLPTNLRKQFDVVPTKQKTNSDAFSAFFVSPSVVPTYFPTVRVWTYNATRPSRDKTIELRHARAGPPQPHTYAPLIEKDDPRLFESDSTSHVARNDTVLPSTLNRNHVQSNRKRKRKHKKHAGGPRFTSPDSPSRKNTYLTLLGYSQWVLDLDQHNKKYRKEEEKGEEHSGLSYQLEYTTYVPTTLWSEYLGTRGKDEAHVPIPKQLLDRELSRLKAPPPSLTSPSWFLRPFVKAVKRRKSEVHLPKKLRHLTSYSISYFTVDHLLEWARELAGNDKMWKIFARRIYTESEE